MILGFTWLDLALVVLLVLFFVRGMRHGLWVVLGTLLGFGAGAVAAFYALPFVAERVPDPMWRVAAMLAVVVVLLAVGQAIGSRLGEAIRLRVGLPVLRRIDRWLGGVAAVVVTALLMGLVSFSLGSLGSPALTRAVARSQVLTWVDAATPDAVLAWAARTRSAVAGLEGLPERSLPRPGSTPDDDGGTPVAGGDATPSGAPEPARPSETVAPSGSAASTQPPSARPPSTQPPSTRPPSAPAPSAPAPSDQSEAPAPVGPEAPSGVAAPTSPPAPTGTPVPPVAPDGEDPAASVVRLTGTAEQCDQVQSGTGVAIAPDRVLTNAHVVAGVEHPTVEDRERGVYDARIVALDTAKDLAVLAVDGADLPVMPLGEELLPGQSGEAMGFPDGGPFALTSATVDASGEVPLQDVIGTAVSFVDVYTLTADIRHGYSGGPVVSPEGDLVGLVFARAPGEDPVAYALTVDAIAAEVAGAAGLTATVPAGACVPGG